MVLVLDHRWHDIFSECAYTNYIITVLSFTSAIFI